MSESPDLEARILRRTSAGPPRSARTAVDCLDLPTRDAIGRDASQLACASIDLNFSGRDKPLVYLQHNF